MSWAAVIASTAAVITLPALANAAPMYCAPRNDVVGKFADSRHEQPSSVALTNDGQLLEVLKSDNGLAWTMLITTPQGLICVVAEGDDWQSKEIDKVAQDRQF